jgi:cullin 4
MPPPQPDYAGNVSSSLSPRRRPRVDSFPSTSAAPDPKRPRSGDVVSSGGIFSMATKALGKRPEVIDLTKRQPAFQPHNGARVLVVKNLRATNGAANAELYYQRTIGELEAALDAIYQDQQPRQPMERLHRGVEDVCRNHQEQQLHAILVKKCELHLENTVAGRIQAEATGGSDVQGLRVVLRQWKTWCDQSVRLFASCSF